MAYVLPVGLGVVAGLFLFIILGEVFYLAYWRKRRLANPRVNNIAVGALRGVASVGVREVDSRDVAIDVTCATYQISALHQDLVEKLFPATGSADSPQTLMGPPRMLFTITEETREELEGLDLDGRARSRRNSRSKSMSDISLSPISTPFATPLSSPEPFVTPYGTPYGTPTYSPLVALTRSLSANSVVLKTSCRIMYDYANLPPPAPPSPTRPTFPFLARPTSPCGPLQVEDPRSVLETNGHMLAPSSKEVLYSPPRKPFVFATSPIHSKQVESAVKSPSSNRTCKYTYENGTYSPSSPSSPMPFPSAFSPVNGAEQGSHNEIDGQSWPPSWPLDFSADAHTPPSETAFASNGDHPATSSSFKPWSQRSSSVLFSSASRPHRSPVLNDHIPSKAFRVSGPQSPPIGSPTMSPSWNERHLSIPSIQATASVQ